MTRHAPADHLLFSVSICSALPQALIEQVPGPLLFETRHAFLSTLFTYTVAIALGIW